MHDHRPLGWEPSHGPQPYIAALRSLVDLAPDVQLRLDHGEMCRSGYLSLVTWAGTHEGGVFEAPSYIVGALDAQMRARRFDQYDLDQLDEALARFAALRADPLCVPPNAATRAIDRWIERARARDGAAIRALVAPDAVFEDRRRAVSRARRARGGCRVRRRISRRPRSRRRARYCRPAAIGSSWRASALPTARRRSMSSRSTRTNGRHRGGLRRRESARRHARDL